jgi:hypothetical protein
MDKKMNNLLYEKRDKRHWYENYLPFIARSPRMQIDWLIATFRKGTLTCQEIAPYIRLLLEEDKDEELLRNLFQTLDEWVLTEMLRAADIYDTPRLFRLIPHPSLAQAGLALGKAVPPYETKVDSIRDKIFRAVHSSSEELLKEAMDNLQKRGEVTPEFAASYERFNEILMDAKILSSLYPKAKLQSDPQ